jgi:hypothetical protein
VNHHTVACRTYKDDADVHAKSHHFRSLAFQSFSVFSHCFQQRFRHCSHSVTIAEKTAHDLPTVDKPAADDAKSDSGVESAAPTTSYSPTLDAIKMADKKVSEMTDFFKKTTVIEQERQAYHNFGWLSGNLMSTIPEVDIPTVHDSTVFWFKSHLIAGLGLPSPQQILVCYHGHPRL